MLPKKYRASRKVVDKIFKKSSVLSSPALNFKFINSPGSLNISFIVPKNVSKSAVKRNLLRRRGYKAVQKNFTRLPKDISGVFILKSPAPAGDLEKEIALILSKLK